MKRLFVESSLHYAACLPDPSEAIEIILKETDISVDEINDNMESALFLAVRSNNHAAMAVLMGEQGLGPLAKAAVDAAVKRSRELGRSG